MPKPTVHDMEYWVTPTVKDWANEKQYGRPAIETAFLRKFARIGATNSNAHLVGVRAGWPVGSVFISTPDKFHAYAVYESRVSK